MKSRPDPYAMAVEYIQDNPDTDGATRIAKFLLSLWNSENYPFSFAECVRSNDEFTTALALHIATHYARNGQTASLRLIGKVIQEKYPDFGELGSKRRCATCDFNQMRNEE